jgi:hypothetical protein
MNGRDEKFTEMFILKIKWFVKSEIWGRRMDSSGKGYKPVPELLEGGIHEQLRRAISYKRTMLSVVN